MPLENALCSSSSCCIIGRSSRYQPALIATNVSKICETKDVDEVLLSFAKKKLKETIEICISYCMRMEVREFASRWKSDCKAGRRSLAEI